MVAKLKVASLGLGGIVKNRLVDGIEKSKYCSFAGAYDPKMDEDGKKFLAEHGGRVYGSEDEVLNDPNVKIALVASPHHEHYRQTKLALEAGKHVWVEKPLATKFEEAERLYEKAKGRSLGLWVDSMMRNNWLNQRADKIIQRGEL